MKRKVKNKLPNFVQGLQTTDFKMEDINMIKSMLRAVVMSKKEGVQLRRVLAEYHSLTGEMIPFRNLGYNNFEAFLRSMPDVILLRRNREGEEKTNR